MNQNNAEMAITTGKVILIYMPYAARPNSFRTARHAANFWANEKADEWFNRREYDAMDDFEYNKLLDQTEAIRKKFIRRSLPIFKRLLA